MGTVNELLTITRKQLSVREDPPNSNNVRYNTWYYGREVSGSAYPWCAVFVQWCFAQAGVKLPKRTASCGDLMRAAKAAGCWVTADFQPGDAVIYDFSGKRQTTEHCGVVEVVLPGYGVQAIEGNTSPGQSGSQDNGGGVFRRTRSKMLVRAYIRPFTEKKEDDMTQEQFNQMFKTAMDGYRQELRDNDCGQWSQEAREYAVSSGLFAGSGTAPDGQPNFMWEDLLTREQVAQLFFRFAQKNGLA